MPDGKTHDLITIASITAMDMAYFKWAPHPEPKLAVLFTVSYLFAGFACAGDLDLDSSEYYRWGPLRIIWWPYKALVPHRSWVSHGLIMGGVIRLLYMLAVFTGLLWIASWCFSQVDSRVHPSAITGREWVVLTKLVQTHPKETIALLSGFILAGSAHTIADYISTGIKRGREGRRKRHHNG